MTFPTSADWPSDKYLVYTGPVYSQGLSELKLEKSPFNSGGSCEAPELPANIVKKTGLQKDKGAETEMGG